MSIKYEVNKGTYDLMARLRQECNQVLTRNFKLAMDDAFYSIDDVMMLLAHAGMN